MITNGADPAELVGFAQSLDGVAAAVTDACTRAAWAFARYQRDCADVAVPDQAIARAGDALERTRALTGGTRHVAAAFEAADRGRGHGSVRLADDGALAAALATTAHPDGRDVSPSDGVVTAVDPSWSLDADGITAALEASAFYGYSRERSTDFDLGPLATRHEVDAFVGVEAVGEASISVGRNGVKAGAEGEIFAGARARTRHAVDLGPCSVEVEGTASAGAGASGEVEAEISRDRLGVGGRFETVLGVGGGLGASASCRPPDLAPAGRWLQDRADDVGDALAEGGEAVDRAGRAIRRWLD